MGPPWEQLNNMIQKAQGMVMEPVFMECDACRAKPGTPQLCAGCLHNRAVIGKLNLNEVAREYRVAPGCVPKRRASPVLSCDKLGKRMFDLLCDAAGVDALKVRAIECRCGVKEIITFRVETLGEPELIAMALERNNSAAPRACEADLASV